MWLYLTYIVTLIYISEGHLNKRLQRFYENLLQKKWVVSLDGEPVDHDPYSYLRRSSPNPDNHDPYSYLRRSSPDPDDHDPYSHLRAQPHDPDDRDPSSQKHRRPMNQNKQKTSQDKACRSGVESLVVPGDEWADYEKPADPNLNDTLFCPVLAKENGAIEVTNEAEFPWLARVYHNQPDSHLFEPLICTAAVVAERVFITAARCISEAKSGYTTVEFNYMRFGVDAFVYPSSPSKQMFDDIGLIVTSKGEDEKFWKTPPTLIEFIEKPKRPVGDEHYNWFQDWALQEPTNTVVGYLAPKEQDLSAKPPLYKLDKMYASNFLCNKILPAKSDSNDYWVPCAHSCTPKQHLSGSNCSYLIGLGHVVLNENAKLIGVVTWNCEHGETLGSPVGMAVPNSEGFDLHLQCAYWLVSDTNKTDSKERMRKICDDKIFSEIE